MNVNDLIDDLKSLEGMNLVRVFEALEHMRSKAAKLQQERDAAYLKLVREFPRCSCGKPIGLVGSFYVEHVRVKPAIVHSPEGMRACVATDVESYDTNYDVGPMVGRMSGQEGRRNRIGYCSDSECPGFTWIGPEVELQEMKSTEFNVTEALNVEPSPLALMSAVLEEK